MKKYKYVPALLMIIVPAVIASCTTTYIVAPQKGDCYGLRPMKCLLIKKDKKDSEWQNFYGTIECFDYIPGYEYVIKVKETEIKSPAADRPSKEYKLKRIVSKIPVSSED